jgi:hypothetical protein
MAKENSIVGDLINFRGLVYSPINEDGVIFLFGRVVDDLHMYIEEIKPGFPDCVARRYTGKGWERILIEFEYQSSNFRTHGHDQNNCDIIVCWENDWKNCPLEVIELKNEIVEMENWPVKKPTSTREPGLDGIEALQQLFINHKIPVHIQDWYHQIEKELIEFDPEIWMNVKTKYIGVYSPEKAFASIEIRPTVIKIECFSRGVLLDGTKVANVKFSPRWAKFSIQSSDQLLQGIEILKESHRRIKSAIHEGEYTAYFSGGVRPGENDLHKIRPDDQDTN